MNLAKVVLSYTRGEVCEAMNSNANITLNWLKQKPELQVGVTWGVPWVEGTLQREESIALHGSTDDPLPIQSWPTAYWPDGSVKWTAHAATLQAGDGYSLSKGQRVIADSPLKVEDMESYIEVNTGVIVCRLNKKGSSIIREIIRSDNRVCSDGKLIGIREVCSMITGRRTLQEEVFYSHISNVSIEQAGVVRAVVKITGRHVITSEALEWLPFTLRLYFYANQQEIKAVHTFLYDGNPHKDFIKGLGMTFGVPMRGPLYNRHVRFAGDSGFFSESPKGLMTLRTSGNYMELYRQQTAGGQISLSGNEDRAFLDLLEDSAVWDSFKLVQHTADSYTISKRTKEVCSWLKSAVGQRSGGLLYVGGEGGGLSVGIRHFWKKHPSSLEVNQLTQDEAVITAWFWSPDAQAMDLRHYDTATHVKSSYEGADEMRSSPYGIGNTNEISINCFEQTPEHDILSALVEEKESPSLLVCTPQHYHSTAALGVWSLAERSTETKAMLEDALDEVVQFYQEEVEQRSWYGFWDYGDFMHSYDPVRHTWKYDIGGCAWQNTELVPNIWLWYMFLRSGREDIFRLAEAMTRHTSEVDLYHIGEYAGLGSRHNVSHWGCGCKEARIGMTALHKFYYYLTADERIGDIMNDVRDSDYTTEHIDPMRAYYPKDEFPTHARSGPDWAAFCSNWLTRWERFEDTTYRDKIIVGMSSLKKMPFRLLTGPVFGYDPRDGVLHHMGDENWGHHLMICMGAPQVWMEMSQLLKDPAWDDMMVEFGEFYNLPKEEKISRTSGAIQGVDWNIPMLSTGMMAFAANQMNNLQLAEQAWGFLLKDQTHWQIQVPLICESIERLAYIRPIREIPWMTTNTAAQWCLNVIVCLELIGDQLPDN